MDFNVIELLDFCLTNRIFLKERLTNERISLFICSLKNEKKRRRKEKLKEFIRFAFCILMGQKP